ncbi:MAG TPA: gamma-glutamyltransferase [Mycobacteriales bacterium]|nr:gamma-glutamyltransferase [Mycobacteriales bacterium]
MRVRRRAVAMGAAVGAVLAAAGLAVTAPAVALHQQSSQGERPGTAQPLTGSAVKQPVATGYGGAVSTVDLDASQAGLAVLRRGGNAVDAAVAAAATLGVTEPYSAGIGGGGFFVYYQARTHRVLTLDGRETAPRAMGPTAFVNPATGLPLPFADAVTSGLSVGVPGTPALWSDALRAWGTTNLGQALRPAIAVAERGFTVDATFQQQTAANAARFAHFSSTAALYLPGGQPPAVGSTFRNPDLARTYRRLARSGVGWLYGGGLAADIVRTVHAPPLAPGSTYNARPGLLEPADLAAYRAVPRTPTHVTYHGLDVYGMAPPSSGGSTVGEALNILSNVDLSPADRVSALHDYLESTRLAFADRNRYVGDPAATGVPLAELLSRGFAKERACLIDPAHAATSPVPPGSPDGDYAGCPAPAGSGHAEPYEGRDTSNLVTADRWGNVVAYTLTIEQTGGSGIVVPGRGFLLNNELTDFNFAPTQGAAPDPNLPGPGKRPRSSMAPTIVLRDGRPLLAVGSPGGATIITTVLQVLLNRLDLGMSLADAIAAPRASQRNGANTEGEPAFLALYQAALQARGHSFTTNPEIGAATGLELLGHGLVTAAAEPVRRGGGSALVVHPSG